MGRRKCSHCGKIGHNCRTCTSFTLGVRELRLFGVQLSSSSSSNNNNNNNSSTIIKKSFSMDTFPSPSSPTSSFSSSTSLTNIHHLHKSTSTNLSYLSDCFIGTPQERKKGVPWTEDEHRIFLIGLEKMGKGDWRGISRNFVTTRTPTQVASHAQKYFLRLATINSKKRRSSLFDLVESKNTNIKGQGHANSVVLDHKLKDTKCKFEVNDATTLSYFKQEEAAKSDNQEINHSQVKVKVAEENKHHHHQAVPFNWLNHHHSSNYATVPNLDLTLATAPPKLEQNKPSSGPLIFGPISVT